MKTIPPPDDPRSTRMPTASRSLARYLPALAVLLGLAIWVTAVPSSRSATVAGSEVDLFGTVAGGRGGPTTGARLPGAGNAPGTSEAAGGGTGVGDGASATGAGDPAVGADGGDVSASGEAGPGADAAVDCSRNEISSGRTCRPPAVTGDNGGATFRGVTPETIRVVAYQVRQNEQVQAILAAAGSPTNAQREAAFVALVNWFNANFELYGRRIEPIFYVGTTPANDAAGQQADAVHVAEELDAFAVLTMYPAPIFHEELHRRGVLNFTWNQLPHAFYESVSPHTLGLFPDSDTVLAHQAEYWCQRLRGGNADHAGLPAYRGPRVFGIIYQDGTDNGPALADLARSRCGIEVAKMVSYPADIANAAAISTNAVTQLQQAGVTTVTCLCDLIAPVFFTAQASKQGWFPEWIHNGFFLTDANAAGRLYDPTQWGNSFGPSSLSFPVPTAENPGYRVCRAGGGDHVSCVKAQASYYAFLAFLANALEQVGPTIDDVGVARAIVSAPPLGGDTPNAPLYSFGPQGPGPYTYIDDLMEIWYDPNRDGPDGERGAAFYVESGRRYDLGAWPASAPNVFVDDGSPQPPRDPDL